MRKISFISFVFCSTSFAQDVAVISGKNIFMRENSGEAVSHLKAVNLEDVSNFDYELGGQSSVNLKAKSKDGKTSVAFVCRNEAANANTEIAYFTLARILGVENLFRATVPYALGPNATKNFAAEIRANEGHMRGMKLKNAQRTLGAINSNPSQLKGCLKEKKRGHTLAMNSLGTNGPNLSHALFRSLQASNSQPNDNTQVEFRESSGRYFASAKTIAHQYSILMTFDAIFNQYDRYSGDNVVFRADDQKRVELHSTDNGGADFGGTNWARKQSSWFSRYDKQVISDLQKIYSFLTGKISQLRSERLQKTWTSPRDFVVDIGLWYERSSDAYVRDLTADLGVLLNAVKQNVDRYGEAQVFFQ